MKRHLNYITLVLLLITPAANSVTIDVNDVSILDTGVGEALYVWDLGASGFSFEPGRSYSLDVEFQPGQFFDLRPNLVGNEIFSLFFGSFNGPSIIDPGLTLSSGSLGITGLNGDLDVSNPMALTETGFVGNWDGNVEDLLEIRTTGDLTSDGFRFSGLNFMYTFDSSGAIYPVDGQVTLVITAGAPQAVPVPSTIWLFGAVLLGLVGFKLKKVERL